MFTRPPNVPPRMSFQIPRAISCGLLRGGAIVPARMKDCAAPGLSIKYNSACFGAATFGMLFLGVRSEEHTSELQSRLHLVCRLLLEKKKDTPHQHPLQPVPCDSRARRLIYGS